MLDSIDHYLTFNLTKYSPVASVEIYHNVQSTNNAGAIGHRSVIVKRAVIGTTDRWVEAQHNIFKL